MGPHLLASQFLGALFWPLALAAFVGLVVYPPSLSIKNRDAAWTVAIALSTLALVVPGIIVGLVYLLVSRRSGPRS